jgi:hypothetical protein
MFVQFTFDNSSAPVVEQEVLLPEGPGTYRIIVFARQSIEEDPGVSIKLQVATPEGVDDGTDTSLDTINPFSLFPLKTTKYIGLYATVKIKAAYFEGAVHLLLEKIGS